MLQRILALVILAMVLVGCAAQLRTAAAPAAACDGALASGRLVGSADSGLALVDSAGAVIPVLWPHGYTARREVTGIILIGQKGETLAHEGDLVAASGGAGNDGEFVVCDGTVRVVPPTG